MSDMPDSFLAERQGRPCHRCHHWNRRIHRTGSCRRRAPRLGHWTEIRDRSSRCQAIPGSIALDVTKPITVDAAISTIVTEEGCLNAVVNNAGIGMMGAMGDTSEEELLTVYHTNVVGLHTVSRAAIPHLIASQGHLLHVGSVAGVVGLPFRGVYCSSKAAVELIAEAQSMELARHGVRVTVLRPGDFKTAINANRLRVAHPNHTINPGFEAVCDAVNAEVAHAKDPADMGKAVLKLLDQKKAPAVHHSGTSPATAGHPPETHTS